MKTMFVYPNEVRIEKRFREDIGDLTNLERSLRKIGLLQPIGITEDNKLVWGYRRLKAWEKVKGNIPIPAIVFPKDLAGIAELVENIHRLNLPWHIQDKAIAELHKWFEEQAKRDFSSESDKKSLGRPPKPWTHEDTANLLGLSRSKVTTAINLAEKFDEYSELKTVETEQKALIMLQRFENPSVNPFEEPSKPSYDFECPCGRRYRVDWEKGRIEQVKS